MIESEEKRKRITDIIERWTETTKVKPYLRDFDIPSLVSSIIGEFYRIHLCCGHQVAELSEQVHIEFEDNVDGERAIVSGTYCRDCAEEYKKDWGAKEIKD